MRSRISARATALAAILSLSATAGGWALEPTPASIVILDADARAQGNRIDIARRIGDVAFRTRWSAQVVKVAADGIGSHIVAQLRISGAKFHTPMTRADLTNEIAALVADAFAVAPIEEVDVSVEIPVDESKGVVVSGDLAKPTSQTVFTISVLRSERGTSVRDRLRSGKGVFWDEDWAKTALKGGA